MTTMLFAKYKTGWKFIDDNSGFAACKCCIILGLFFRPSSGLCFSHSPNWHLENDNQRTSYLYSRRRRKKFMIGIVECCVLLFFVLYCCCEEESTLWTNGRMCLFKLKMLCNILALEWYRMSFFWRCTQSCTLIRNGILAFSLREIFLRLPNLVWQMAPC